MWYIVRRASHPWITYLAWNPKSNGNYMRCMDIVMVSQVPGNTSVAEPRIYKKIENRNITVEAV